MPLHPVGLHRLLWQLPLHPDSQDAYTIITQWHKIKPNRVIQGGKNSAQHAQFAMTDRFRDQIGKSHLVYMDNISSFAKDPLVMIANVELTMKKLHEKGIKIGIKSFCLGYQLHFCGRVYNKLGITHDPARVQITCHVTPPLRAPSNACWRIAVNTPCEPKNLARIHARNKLCSN